jgi:hypothetical protein
MLIFDPVRRRTTMPSTVGHFGAASSTIAFNLISLPRRYTPSAVTIALHWQSFTRSLIESAENPPKITV